ncbi:hypothetical protein BD779DRAFT_1527552 [Infundibulicybe gibba]|nr:hypothetical protein BD779DRAFT_1527552 [Infundibulicybe gibba]
MSTTEIILSLQQVQIATYFNVASIAVLVYDWFLTFELELASIWSAPWNLGTLLYTTGKWPFSVLLSLILCKAAQHDSGHRSAVVSKCFRHGIMYYVVLDALSVINPAISIQRAQGIDGLLASIQRAFHAILSGRMLLHLRYSARQWAREYVNTTSISLGGEIRFRPRLEDSTNTNDRSRMSVI